MNASLDIELHLIRNDPPEKLTPDAGMGLV